MRGSAPHDGEELTQSTVPRRSQDLKKLEQAIAASLTALASCLEGMDAQSMDAIVRRARRAGRVDLVRRELAVVLNSLSSYHCFLFDRAVTQLRTSRQDPRTPRTADDMRRARRTAPAGGGWRELRASLRALQATLGYLDEGTMREVPMKDEAVLRVLAVVLRVERELAWFLDVHVEAPGDSLASAATGRSERQA